MENSQSPAVLEGPPKKAAISSDSPVVHWPMEKLTINASNPSEHLQFPAFPVFFSMNFHEFSVSTWFFPVLFSLILSHPQAPPRSPSSKLQIWCPRTPDFPMATTLSGRSATKAERGQAGPSGGSEDPPKGTEISIFFNGKNPGAISGWWFLATPLKNMSSWIGMMTATQYSWENIIHGNQTTKQILMAQNMAWRMVQSDD